MTYILKYIEGGSVNRSFKTPVIIANTGHRKGPSRKLGCGKIAAHFLHIPTSRGDRSASPPDFSVSYFSRKFSDLDTHIYRAPLYAPACAGRKVIRVYCGLVVRRGAFNGGVGVPVK
jgi:hypothetical protein